jgi:predicted metalloendopeptidase
LAAASLLDSMDEEEDPCDDFYSFVCGGFIDKAEIPEHSGVHSTLGEISAQNSYRVHKLLTVPKTTVSQAEQQLRDFYSSKNNLFLVLVVEKVAHETRIEQY